MFYFADIEASEKTKGHYRFEHKRDVFVGPFERINIFVGQNNSGKSRFLRELFCCENMVGSIPKDSSAFETLEFVESRRKTTVAIYNTNAPVNRNNIENITIDDFVRVLFCRKFAQYTLNHFVRFDLNNIPSIGENSLPDSCFEKRFYVPMIRGMRPFERVDDVYRKRTDADYFQSSGAKLAYKLDNLNKEDAEDSFQSKVSPRILTGLGIYQDLKKRLLGKFDQRRKIDDYRQWLKDHFFEGQTIEVIADEEKEVVSLTIDETQEHYIYDWGDGMQNLLILTYWPFMHNKGAFFIEEPDVSFHPSMQRKLLEAYTSDALIDCQFFMTTHSNHLINVASVEEHVGVFTFRKTFGEDAKVRIKKIDHKDREPLLLLGAQPSSVMMSNCTIWVEGISDRLTLRHFLSLYFQCVGEDRLREDLHYIFMETSGSNVEHLSFVSDDETINTDYLCSVAFLIADSDGYEERDGSYKVEQDGIWVSDEKGERLDAIKARLGDNAYILTVREFENLHTPKFIEDYVLSFRGMKKYREATDEHKAFQFDDERKRQWATEYIGTLIHEQYKALGYPDSANKFAEKKTITEKQTGDDGDVIEVEKKVYRGAMTGGHKKELPKHASKGDIAYSSFEELSEEAKDLIRAMYKFITDKNNLEPKQERT